MTTSYNEPKIKDPYEFLGVKPTSSKYACKAAFKKLLKTYDIDIKRKASLAYDIICNKNKYILKNGYYEAVNKDHFYYTMIGDLKSLVKLYTKDKNILKEKDELGRNLLYIAARNGFNDICEFLLEEGIIDPNDTQNSKSTPLHGAAFYEQVSTVELLLNYGALTTIKNVDGKTALEDTHSEKIKEYILGNRKDKITSFFHSLLEKGLAQKLILVKYNSYIIGKKIIRNEKYLPTNFSELNNTWTVGWHGTKFEFLESIMKYGLYPSGSTLEDGTEIKPLPGHVKLKTKVDKFEDWAKAIFVSPSIFYAGHPVYAKKIDSDGITYSVLVETRIKPGTYSEHPPTVVKYVQKNGEPIFVEYRIKVIDDSNLIMRIESEKNVIVTGILFARTDFLQNVKDYFKGEIYVNSKEEKNLFLTKQI